LGRELAHRYDTEENRLFLLARRVDKLKSLQNELILAKSEIYQIDINNFTLLNSLIVDILKDSTIDIVIANAGISLGHNKESLSIIDFQQVINTNLLSIHALLEPIIQDYKRIKKGKIVLISSLASYVCMPSSIAYSVSKRALSAYAEGIRNQLKPYGIKVLNIKPGFIKSEMTDKNSFNMPFLLSTKDGVNKIYNAIESEKQEYAFPFKFFLIVKIISLLPVRLKDYIIQKVHFKK